MSLVHIVEDGQRAQMSKRSGDFVSLDDLIDKKNMETRGQKHRVRVTKPREEAQRPTGKEGLTNGLKEETGCERGEKKWRNGVA